MKVALDPASTAFFHQYVLHGDSRNHAISLRCKTRLEKEKLSQALALTLQQHPLLRSIGITDRSKPKYWYYWQTQDKPEIPLQWIALQCAKNRCSIEIRNAEHENLNKQIALDKELPFRLYVYTSKETTMSHCQIVMSHAAGDGRSLVLFLQDLINNYQKVITEKTDSITDYDYASGNWEVLFSCPIDKFTRRIITTPVLRDNQRRRFTQQPCVGKEDEWQAVQKTLAHNREKQDDSQVMDSFPGLKKALGEEIHPMKVLHHQISSRQVEKLTTIAKKYKSNVYDLITVCYLQTHMEMSKQLGESSSIIPLTLLTDLRQVSKIKKIKTSLGNLVMGIRTPIDVSETAEIGYLLKTITEQKLLGLKDWKVNLKKNLFLAVIQELVPTACLKSFMKVVTQERKSIPVSHLGNLNSLFKNADSLEISRLETMPVASPVSFQTIQYNNQIGIAYSYLEDMIDGKEAKKLWEKFTEHLLTMINSEQQ